MISLVTAKIVRANAQYAYRLKGVGEKYLVIHGEKENPADKIISYLTPYAAEDTTVSVESVSLQKNAELIETCRDEYSIYKCSVRGKKLTDSGKVVKFRRYYFIPCESIFDAHALLSIYLEEDMLWEAEICSIQKTNIIEIK